MAADEFAILRERDVALDDACALARRGHVRLACVLGELKRGAAVADREVGRLERAGGALLERRLEFAVGHGVDEERRPGAELDGSTLHGRVLRQSEYGPKDQHND